MLSKKKRRLLKERRREKKFWEEIDREDLEDRKIAITAMRNLYGFTEQESEDYFSR